MAKDARIALFLRGELVVAIRANNLDLFKRWLYVGIEELGDPSVSSVYRLISPTWYAGF